MSVKIVTDSACDLPAELIGQLGIEIVPIRINLGRQSFRDDIKTRAQQLASPPSLPTTSQPPPREFEQVFVSLLEQGHTVLCLTLSSVLSGTYHSALIAANQVAGDIQVVDTKLVSAGQGLLVLQAARRAIQGEKLEEISAWAEARKELITTYAILDNIEPIVRGGRLTLFARHAAGRQGIKLIFTLKNGGVQILQRIQGRRPSLDRLAELVGQNLGTEIGLTHVDCIGEAQLVAVQARERGGAQPLFIGQAGSTVSTYAGRGAIIVAG